MNPQTTTHTATPWHLNSTEAHGEACAYAAVIIGAESAGSPCVASLEFGGTIETDSETTRANAALIVRAVNSHAQLVAALATILDATDYTARNCSQTDAVGAVLDRVLIIQARRALSLAKGEA